MKKLVLSRRMVMILENVMIQKTRVKQLSYAGLKSNKGDRILLAEGNYLVDDVDTLFYLLSDLVPVEGSYSLATKFKKSDKSHITRLIGVPLEYADKLADRGFTVVS